MWSIGSAGETCFEEYVHRVAPHCRIDSFDPTLPEKAEQHMLELQEKGVLQYHKLGLGEKLGHFSMKRYRDPLSSSRCNDGDVFSNRSKLSARERRSLHCLEVRVYNSWYNSGCYVSNRLAASPARAVP